MLYLKISLAIVKDVLQVTLEESQFTKANIIFVIKLSLQLLLTKNIQYYMQYLKNIAAVVRDVLQVTHEESHFTKANIIFVIKLSLQLLLTKNIPYYMQYLKNIAALWSGTFSKLLMRKQIYQCKISAIFQGLAKSSCIPKLFSFTCI